MDLDVTTSLECSKFARKELGVRPRYVDIRILLGVQTIDKALKIRNKLHLVKKEVGSACLRHFLSNGSPSFTKSRKLTHIRIFKVDGDDLLVRNALGLQRFAEKLKQRSLSATPNPRHHLNDISIFPLVKPMRKTRSFYGYHTKDTPCAKVFGGMIPKNTCRLQCLANFMSEIWPSPAKACPQIRGQPAGACPQMSGGVLGLVVWVFASRPIRPVRRIRPVTPRQKEKRFPNRFHEKTTSAFLSKRK